MMKKILYLLFIVLGTMGFSFGQSLSNNEVETFKNTAKKIIDLKEKTVFRKDLQKILVENCDTFAWWGIHKGSLKNPKHFIDLSTLIKGDKISGVISLPWNERNIFEKPGKEDLFFVIENIPFLCIHTFNGDTSFIPIRYSLNLNNDPDIYQTYSESDYKTKEDEKGNKSTISKQDDSDDNTNNSAPKKIINNNYYGYNTSQGYSNYNNLNYGEWGEYETIPVVRGCGVTIVRPQAQLTLQISTDYGYSNYRNYGYSNYSSGYNYPYYGGGYSDGINNSYNNNGNTYNYSNNNSGSHHGHRPGGHNGYNQPNGNGPVNPPNGNPSNGGPVNPPNGNPSSSGGPINPTNGHVSNGGSPVNPSNGNHSNNGHPVNPSNGHHR